MRLDPWPEAPELPAPIIMDQRWTDAVFLHWRIPAPVAAPFMPPGVAPDNFDGSAWVGLIGFRMRKRRPGTGARDAVFRELHRDQCAALLPGTGRHPGSGFPQFGCVAVGAGAGCAGCRDPLCLVAGGLRGSGLRACGLFGAADGRAGRRALGPARANARAGFSVRRFRGGARSDFAVVPELDVEATDPLSIHLTARFGLHSRFRGRTVYIPNAHSAWPLYPAQLTHLDDQLVRAAGIKVAGPPESVLFSPGVHTQFGRPRVLHGAH